MNAPIALFIYNRPDHLRETLKSLLSCTGFAESPIFVFGDGPRSPMDEKPVESARSAARELLGDRATYAFSDANKGLSASVLAGVGRVLAEHDSTIVVEDDLRLAPEFLTFMNAALARYADEQRVYQVSGYAFEAPEIAAKGEAVLLPFISTWGWGTWRRAWRHMDPAATGWEDLGHDRQLRHRFNLDGVYDYASMLEGQMTGRRDSWGVRWYWSVFRRDGLVIYPPRTLVSNEGFDGSGSHGRGLLRHFGARGGWESGGIAPKFPSVRPDHIAYAAAKRAILRQNGGLPGRVVDFSKRLMASFARRT